MKILDLNEKKAFFKVKIENADDLWYLSQLIEKNDLVSGKTERKVKLGESDERNVKIIKKPCFLEIEVEKIEFSKFQNWLRVSGRIRQGPEDVQKGSYHTFNLEPDVIVNVQKKELLKYQVQRLRESAEEKEIRVLIVVHDREDVIFAKLNSQGYDLLSEKKGEVEKKFEGSKVVGNFYEDIIKIIKEYDSRYNFHNIVVASPAFFKDDLMKLLKDDALKKKIVLATCSTADENGIKEVVKRAEIKNVLKQNRYAIEIQFVEEVLKEIMKQGAVAYGLKEVENATNMGAIKNLLVSDELIMKMREEENYEKLEAIMKNVESAGGEVHIINSEHEGGKKLNGLGGIAALLRYKVYE